MTTEVAPTIKVRTNIFKGCRRCGGLLRLERNLAASDREAADYVCLQCGRHSSLGDEIARSRDALARSDKSW